MTHVYTVYSFCWQNIINISDLLYYYLVATHLFTYFTSLIYYYLMFYTHIRVFVIAALKLPQVYQVYMYIKLYTHESHVLHVYNA